MDAEMGEGVLCSCICMCVCGGGEEWGHTLKNHP